MIVKRGIEKAVEVAVEAIKKNSKTVESRKPSPRLPPFPPTVRRSGASLPMPWKRSAKTASSPWKNPRIGTTLEIVEGMQFDRGISPTTW